MKLTLSRGLAWLIELNELPDLVDIYRNLGGGSQN